MNIHMPKIKRVIMQDLKNNTKEYLYISKKLYMKLQEHEQNLNVLYFNQRITSAHAKAEEDLTLLDRLNYVRPQHLAQLSDKLVLMQNQLEKAMKK